MPMGRDDTDISALHKLDDVYRALPVLLADVRAFSASLDAHRQQSLERYDALANKVDALEAAHAAAMRVLIAPRKMGGTVYGFISAQRTAASYPDFISDDNLFIAESAPPAGEVPLWVITGVTTFDTLAGWQGQDFPNGSAARYPDLHSTLVTA